MEKKQQVAYRYWCVTINNPEVPDTMPDFPKDNIQYAIFQTEKGEKGTTHYQGYVELIKPWRMNKLKALFPTSHLEKRRGNAEQARDYCKKEESRIAGPWEYGEFNVSGGSGRRNDLLDFKKDIDSGMTELEIVHKHFKIWARNPELYSKYKLLTDDGARPTPKVFVLYGPPGCGKTHRARTMYGDLSTYWKPPNDKWFDSYIGQKVVIFDEFTGWLMFNNLVRLLDSTPLQVEVKGGFRWMKAEYFIFTSNKKPEQWYRSQNVHFAAFARRVTEWMVVEKLYAEPRVTPDYAEFKQWLTLFPDVFTDEFIPVPVEEGVGKEEEETPLAKKQK